MQHTVINQSEVDEDKWLLFFSLSRITFLTFEEKVFLEKNIDSAIALALMSIDDISLLLKRGFSRVKWNGQENLRMAKVAMQCCENLKIKVLHHLDENYPELLLQITDPPYMLFCRGNEKILSGKNISVVGTRRLTPFGKKSAFQFAYDAANDGCNVISGLAYGADEYAHRGAIGAYLDALEQKESVEKIGKTIAVIPSSIDEIIPGGHKRLAEQILQSGGCIISEYEPRIEMAKWHFVGRNRIIAGLSSGTVVIEAPTGSGALITADFALEYNRDVVFHKAAFSEMALTVAKNVNDKLINEYETGNVSKYKVENKPDKYLDAGAPIISDYKDYCEYLTEEPGKRIKIAEQQLLFDIKEGL